MRCKAQHPAPIRCSAGSHSLPDQCAQWVSKALSLGTRSALTHKMAAVSAWWKSLPSPSLNGVAWDTG